MSSQDFLARIKLWKKLGHAYPAREMLEQIEKDYESVWKNANNKKTWFDWNEFENILKTYAEALK